MFILIFTLLFAVPVAIFATQNTQTVTVKMMQYVYSSVPLYLVVLISLLIGVTFSWLIHIIDIFYSSWEIRNKVNAIKQEKKKNLDLAKKLHELELENAKIKGKYSPNDMDEKSM